MQALSEWDTTDNYESQQSYISVENNVVGFIFGYKKGNPRGALASQQRQ